ncbi:MAG TPA: hypothetical protein VIJ21_00645 [Solirubrobacterales bacterium]
MAKIKAALQRIADRITGRKADLAKSRRRHKVWREHAEELEAKALRAKNHGHARRAAALERRADRAHVKAGYWKGRVRRDDEAVPKLEALEGKLEKELAAWIKEHGVTFEGHNKVRGGTYEQRAHAVQVKAMANFNAGTATVGPAYYSMEGGPRDYAHAIYRYPQGRIYDCSTYADGTCFVTGDPSPSGPEGFTAGGYTETELAHSHKVTGKVKCGDLVVYLRYSGDIVGHHVERVLNPEAKTSTGHGDSAINIGCNGSWDLFGDGLFVVVRPPRHKGD